MRTHPKFFILIPFIFFLSGIAAAGEIEYAEVLNVVGSAEVLTPPNLTWKPLQKNTILGKGSKIRTEERSSVEIGFDANFENAARLGENSRLSLLGELPFKVLLGKGELFIFCEYPIHHNALRILTKDALIQLKLGGCAVIASGKGTLIKVFTDRVQVSNLKHHRPGFESRIIEEGFRFLVSAASPRAAFRRMTYADYADWQVWIRNLYERKDDRMAELLEKEFSP